MLFLIAKGLDGHDASLGSLATSLRDEGFKVVYGGIYQSPEEVVHHSIQEDVELIGLSFHAGGHELIFGRIMELLAPYPDEYVVVAGGIIPPGDQDTLKQLGVRAIFNPADNMHEHIAPLLRKFAGAVQKSRQDDVPSLYQKLAAGDHRALARFISLLEAGNRQAATYLTCHAPHRPRACHVVGLSGNAGVGKSSLLTNFLMHRKQELASLPVGVLCVDPCDASGGAVLADRIYLAQYLSLVNMPLMYVRSLATQRTFKGVTRQTPRILEAMKVAGKELIFVESVGAEQGDVGFHDIVDTFVYVTSPDTVGDMQLLKGGAISAADIIVLNKRDKQGAVRAFSSLQEFYARERSDGWQVPVIETNSHQHQDEGVAQLWQAVEAHRAFLKEK